MSLQVERLEKNMAKLTIEVSPEELEGALQHAYLKNRKQISIPGFRKGKVPRQMIEKMYGPQFFYEDAVNELIPTAYEKAAEECELELVSRPEVSIVQIEKGKPFIFTAEVAVKPEVTLGEYKGIEVEKQDTSATDEEVNAEIDKERESNSRAITVEDRPVQDKDMTVIDFEGFVDGVPFEGGKGTDYPLTIGSGAFIPGFEEQLIGAEIDKETEVKVTFPEDYRAEVKAKIKERKEREGRQKKEDQAVEQAIENSQMDIPQPMIDLEAKQLADDFARRLMQQGMSAEQYFQLTGLSEDKIIEELKPQAEKRIKTRLVLEAVVAAEGIQVSDERLDEELQKMADSYQMEVEKLKEFMGENEKKQMKEDIAAQEAVTLIADAAVEG